jgi:hypothetical protein
MSLKRLCEKQILNEFLTKTSLKSRNVWHVGAYLFPSLLPIFVGDLFLLFIFTKISEPQQSSIIGVGLSIVLYTIAEALFTFMIGRASDFFCRKKLLISLHVASIFLCVVYFFIQKDFIIYLAGVIFVPSVICRTAAFDNFQTLTLCHNKTHKSNKDLQKVFAQLKMTGAKVIAITWITQYSPWAMAPIVSFLFNKDVLLYIILFLTSISLFTSIILFLDSRDSKPKIKHEKFLGAELFKYLWKRVAMLLAGLGIAQVVFFSSFDKIESLTNRPLLFCAVGVGAIMGSLFSMRHRPTIAILSNAYATGAFMSITFLAAALIDFLPIEIQVIQLSGFGGYYLPYVYELVISSGESKHRGTLVAAAETMQSLSAIGGSGMNYVLSNIGVLIVSALAFLSAAFITKESKHNIKGKLKMVKNL